MSIEFTGINKETATGKIKNFLDSYPDDAVFKMVINSKRGNLRLKLKNTRKSRIKKILGRLRRKKSNVKNIKSDIAEGVDDQSQQKDDHS